MKKPLTDEDLLQRAAIDGRVAFAMALLLAAAGLVALLDRVGAPESLVAVLGPGVVVTGMAAIGVLLRTMRISRFYAGGRAMPPAYAGLALAALATALFLPFLPPVASAVSSRGLLIGFAGGLALAALLTGPLLRKTGAFSIPDLIAARFPNIALRLGVVAVVASVGLLVALAGFSSAAHYFQLGVGAPPYVTNWLLAATLVLMGAPGGLAGALWASAGAAGLLVAALGLPLLLLVIRGESLPFPVIGGRAQWEAALTRMVEWSNTGGDTATTGDGYMVVAIVLGLGVLAPLLAPAIATRDLAAARRAGGASIGWSAGIAVVIAVTMAVSTLAYERALVGKRPEAVPAFMLDAARAGGVALCGARADTPAGARAACAATPGFTGVLRAGDLAATGDFLLQGLPALRGFGRAFSGLASAGLTAVALALAAAGFHAFATALGHDAFYRVSDSSAMTSRRLAVTRLLLVAGVVGCGLVLQYAAPDPRVLIGLAIALCASAIAPLLALALWPRAESAHATIALLVGLAAAALAIVLHGGVPNLDVYARAAAIAAGASLLSGIATSFLRQADPASHAGAFVHSVLHGETEVLRPDKGA